MARQKEAPSQRKRQDQIIRFLKTATVPRTTSEITKHINAHYGCNFHRRTIARDLTDLSKQHGLRETPGHPIGFYLDSAADTPSTFDLSEADLTTLARCLAFAKQTSDIRGIDQLERALKECMSRSQREWYLRKEESS